MTTKLPDICTIVLLCKDAKFLELTSKILKSINVNPKIINISDPHKAIEYLELNYRTVDMVLVQYELSKIDGLTMAEYVKSLGLDVIVFTRSVLKVKLMRTFWNMKDVISDEEIISEESLTKTRLSLVLN